MLIFSFSLCSTPLTLAFYPESYWRPKLSLTAGNTDKGLEGEFNISDKSPKDEAHFRHSFVIILERLESLPSMMSFVRLLQPASISSAQTSVPLERVETVNNSDVPKFTEDSGTDSYDKSSEKEERVPELTSGKYNSYASSISINAYRLLALSERTSDLIKASESEVTRRADSILNIFSAFANLLSIPFYTSMSIVPQEEFVDTVVAHAAETNADLLVVPWAAGASLSPDDDGPTANRLESLFGQQAVERSPQYASFARRIFLESGSDVGLFLDSGVSASSPQSMGAIQRIYLPFHGGPDDRAALDFVMQLVHNNSQMTATVTRFVKVAPETADQTHENGNNPGSSTTSPTHGINQLTLGAGLGMQDTIYQGASNTQHRIASDTADNLALARYFPSAMLENSETTSSNTPLLAHVMSRVKFTRVETPSPLQATLSTLRELASQHQAVLVIVGRSRYSAPTHRIELEKYLKDRASAGNGLSSLGIAASSDVRKTLGDLGSAVLVSGEADSVLILQSAIKGNAFFKGKGRKDV